MHKVFRRALIALAMTALSAMGADNSIGTWKLNVAQSKYTPAPFPLKSLTSVREAVTGGVKVTTTGERVNGGAINFSYTAKYDGSPATVTGTGSPYNSMAVKQVSPSKFTYEAKQSDGKYHVIGRTVISSDGKTMTTNTKGTDANGASIGVTLVYDKQ